MKKLLLTFLVILLVPIGLCADWEIVSNMPNPRHGLSAVELNGWIYLIGGQETHGGGMAVSVSTVTAFNPASNQWDTSIADLNHARAYGLAAVYNGFIYVMGGRNGLLPVPVIERYNPQTNTWVDLGNLPLAREGLAGAVLGDSLFVIGGSNPDSLQGMNRVDIFRFSDSTWTTGPPLHHARTAGLTVRAQHRIYVLGGYRFDPLGSMEIFENGAWVDGPNLPQSMANFGGVAVGDSIVIAGGAAHMGNTNRCYVFADDTWTDGPTLNYPRSGLAMAVYNNKVYVFGGSYHHSTVSQVEEWDLKPVGIEDEMSGTPQQFTLGNYPNPFNPSTTISAAIPSLENGNRVRLQVYDLRGRLIYQNAKPYSGPGNYRWKFSANILNTQLAGGVYIYTVRAGGQEQHGKMIFLP